MMPLLTELQLVQGIQPHYGESSHATGNKDMGQGTKTYGRESRKFGGEQLLYMLLQSTKRSLRACLCPVLVVNFYSE